MEKRCAELDALHDWGDADRVVPQFTELLKSHFSPFPINPNLRRYFPNNVVNPEGAIMNALIKSDINFRGMIPPPARIWTGPICLKLQEARSLLYHGMLPKIFFFEKKEIYTADFFDDIQNSKKHQKCVSIASPAYLEFITDLYALRGRYNNTYRKEPSNNTEGFKKRLSDHGLEPPVADPGLNNVIKPPFVPRIVPGGPVPAIIPIGDDLRASVTRWLERWGPPTPFPLPTIPSVAAAAVAAADIHPVLNKLRGCAGLRIVEDAEGFADTCFDGQKKLNGNNLDDDGDDWLNIAGYAGAPQILDAAPHRSSYFRNCAIRDNVFGLFDVYIDAVRYDLPEVRPFVRELPAVGEGYVPIVSLPCGEVNAFGEFRNSGTDIPVYQLDTPHMAVTNNPGQNRGGIAAVPAAAVPAWVDAHVRMIIQINRDEPLTVEIVMSSESMQKGLSLQILSAFVYVVATHPEDPYYTFNTTGMLADICGKAIYGAQQAANRTAARQQMKNDSDPGAAIPTENDINGACNEPGILPAAVVKNNIHTIIWLISVVKRLQILGVTQEEIIGILLQFKLNGDMSQRKYANNIGALLASTGDGAGQWLFSYDGTWSTREMDQGTLFICPYASPDDIDAYKPDMPVATVTVTEGRTGAKGKSTGVKELPAVRAGKEASTARADRGAVKRTTKVSGVIIGVILSMFTEIKKLHSELNNEYNTSWETFVNKYSAKEANVLLYLKDRAKKITEFAVGKINNMPGPAEYYISDEKHIMLLELLQQCPVYNIISNDNSDIILSMYPKILFNMFKTIESYNEQIADESRVEDVDTVPLDKKQFRELINYQFERFKEAYYGVSLQEVYDTGITPEDYTFNTEIFEKIIALITTREEEESDSTVEIVSKQSFPTVNEISKVAPPNTNDPKAPVTIGRNKLGTAVLDPMALDPVAFVSGGRRKLNRTRKSRARFAKYTRKLVN